ALPWANGVRLLGRGQYGVVEDLQISSDPNGPRRGSVRLRSHDEGKTPGDSRNGQFGSRQFRAIGSAQVRNKTRSLYAGDPIVSNQFETSLQSTASFHFEQRFELGELFGLETRNKYAIVNEAG